MLIRVAAEVINGSDVATIKYMYVENVGESSQVRNPNFQALERSGQFIIPQYELLDDVPGIIYV